MEISSPLAITLGIALVWTTAFSMTNRFPLRGYRNLGLLACYVSPLIFIFINGLSSVAITWFVFAIAGALVYTTWEVFQNSRASIPEEKSKVGFGSFLTAPLAWPIMLPEAIEYFLAEVGVLKSAEPNQNQTAEQGGADQPATAVESKPEGNSTPKPKSDARLQ